LLVRQSFPQIRQSFPVVGQPVALVRLTVPLVGGPLLLVHLLALLGTRTRQRTPEGLSETIIYAGA
jgi:hypothetical protein